MKLHELTEMMSWRVLQDVDISPKWENYIYDCQHTLDCLPWSTTHARDTLPRELVTRWLTVAIGGQQS